MAFHSKDYLTKKNKISLIANILVLSSDNIYSELYSQLVVEINHTMILM